MKVLFEIVAAAALIIGGAWLGSEGVDQYRAHRAFAIDSAPGIPANRELLRPSYIAGLSHGQVAIFKQYSRLYPNRTFDVSAFTAGDRDGIRIIASPFPQIILNSTECITEQKLGHRQGQRCIAYD